MRLNRAACWKSLVISACESDVGVPVASDELSPKSGLGVGAAKANGSKTREGTMTRLNILGSRQQEDNVQRMSKKMDRPACREKKRTKEGRGKEMTTRQ